MPAAPLRTELADNYPNPSNAVFKTGIGKLWDFLTVLFGTSGNREDALEALRVIEPGGLHNVSIVPSVAANALTLNVKTRAGAAPTAADPVMVSQRNAAAGAGDFLLRKMTAAVSLVVSSGSTLGMLGNDSSPLYVYVIDNAGAQELAISRTFVGLNGIASTTAEGGTGGADAGDTMYSANARANVAFRCIARLRAPQATAGVWAALPSSVELWPFTSLVAEALTGVGSSIGKNALLGWDFSKNPRLRGSNFLACASGQYVADRVRVDYGTTAVVTVDSASADVPTAAQAGKLITASLKVTVTTADNAVAAGDMLVIREFIEGINFQGLLAQRAFVASGWVKSNKTGVVCVLASNDIDRSYCAEVTIHAADTWEYKRDILFTASPSGGTWNYGNGKGLGFGLCLMGGANYQMAAGAWNNVNKFCTANQINVLDAVNNYIAVADWQLEPGTRSTALEDRNIEALSTMLRRYTRPAGAGAKGYMQDAGAVSFAGECAGMRIAPALVLTDATISIRYQGSSDLTSAGSTIQYQTTSPTGWHAAITGFSGLTEGKVAVERFAQDFLLLDAEI